MPEAIPASAALVADFVNTLDIEDGVDDIDSPGALRRWVGRRMGLRVSKIDEAEWSSVVEVRESLREVLAVHSSGELRPEALRDLNRAGAGARVRIRWDDDGAVSFAMADAKIGGVVGCIFAAAATSQADGTWDRLKVCPADDCRAAFYDHSKNRSGKWCTMSVCGNRAKTRSYRERH